MVLNLEGCHLLRELPERLSVKTLHAKGCTGLKVIPKDLWVNFLGLEGCVSLETLPEDLDLEGWCDLKGRLAFQRLPERMSIGMSLFLQGCRSWDGIIPEGITIARRVFTDTHPGGIDLDEWRHWHPKGERA
jgi:hypothetical protein